MAQLSTVWLRPTSVEADDFVDREPQREELRRLLESLLDENIRQHRILVTGDRGVGKSILSRAVLAEFAAQHADRIVPLVIDGRAIGFRRFLTEVALQLVQHLRTAYDQRSAQAPEGLLAWLDQLSLLATHDEVSEGQVQSQDRKYGAWSEAGAGFWGLLKLSGRFTWEETRRTGEEARRIVRITDDLLHSAIVATLERLARDTDWLVMAVFDDFDQAINAENLEVQKRLLNTAPCISLVHLRTEMLSADVRREMDAQVEIAAMTPETLLDVLRRRLDRASENVRKEGAALERSPQLARLASVTDNPHVFLRWCQGLLSVHEFPPPADWWSDASLARIVTKVAIAGVDAKLLTRFARVLDRCLAGPDQHACRREDLLAGRLATDSREPPERLSAQDVEDLERTGLLLPVNRFNPDAGYRLDPILDLLRPSVAERLRSD